MFLPCFTENTDDKDTRAEERNRYRPKSEESRLDAGHVYIFSFFVDSIIISTRLGRSILHLYRYCSYLQLYVDYSLIARLFFPPEYPIASDGA